MPEATGPREVMMMARIMHLDCRKPEEGTHFLPATNVVETYCDLPSMRDYVVSISNGCIVYSCHYDMDCVSPEQAMTSAKMALRALRQARLMCVALYADARWRPYQTMTSKCRPTLIKVVEILRSEGGLL